jgi:hypothetical protein
VLEQTSGIAGGQQQGQKITLDIILILWPYCQSERKFIIDSDTSSVRKIFSPNRITKDVTKKQRLGVRVLSKRFRTMLSPILGLPKN